MRIAFGCDRNGWDYKNRLMEHARKQGHEAMDFGTREYVPCDSPFYASKVGEAVTSGECKFGVLICGTGTGMTIAANKVKGIMCGLGYSDEETRLMREHNNANIIAFGQDHMGYKDVERRFDIFVSSKFSGLSHQAARIQQIHDLENGRPIALTPIMNPNWQKEGE